MASKNKLQLWKPVVKYFVFDISQSAKHLDEKRKIAILKTTEPNTKRQTIYFLGMTNFCRQWNANYAEIAQALQNAIYDQPMAAQDKIT